MDEIRFSQNKEPEKTDKKSESNSNKHGVFTRWLLKILLFILVLAVLLAFGFYAKGISAKFSGSKNVDYYSAIFLTNGQVYFGKLLSKNDSEMTLSDVYYLQLSEDSDKAQSQLSEPKFSLIKLGNELHGPTDELYINTAQVLFYEKLRDDSKVVQSIKAQSQNNN